MYMFIFQSPIQTYFRLPHAYIRRVSTRYFPTVALPLNDKDMHSQGKLQKQYLSQSKTYICIRLYKFLYCVSHHFLSLPFVYTP